MVCFTAEGTHSSCIIRHSLHSAFVQSPSRNGVMNRKEHATLRLIFLYVNPFFAWNERFNRHDCTMKWAKFAVCFRKVTDYTTDEGLQNDGKRGHVGLWIVWVLRWNREFLPLQSSLTRLILWRQIGGNSNKGKEKRGGIHFVTWRKMNVTIPCMLLKRYWISLQMWNLILT